MLRPPSSSYSVNRLVHRGFLFVYACPRGMVRARKVTIFCNLSRALIGNGAAFFEMSRIASTCPELRAAGGEQ